MSSRGRSTNVTPSNVSPQPTSDSVSVRRQSSMVTNQEPFHTFTTRAVETASPVDETSPQEIPPIPVRTATLPQSPPSSSGIRRRLLTFYAGLFLVGIPMIVASASWFGWHYTDEQLAPDGNGVGSGRIRSGQLILNDLPQVAILGAVSRFDWLGTHKLSDMVNSRPRRIPVANRERRFSSVSICQQSC